MSSGCKGCAERRVTEGYNCHSHCERYKTWKAEWDEARERAQKQIEIDNFAVKSAIKAKRYASENFYWRKRGK